MRQLPQNYPELNDNFLKGLFAVKQSQGNFNTVAGDLKLEQTINRSPKSVGGIKNFCKSFNTDVDNVYSYFTEKATLMSCWNPIFITLLQKKFFRIL